MKKGCVQFEIIVGTYEEFVLGYQFLVEEEHGNKGELTQTFATHSHRASVRSVAIKGKLLVSGGADETINIYNMLTRKEAGMLMEHDGTITSLSFTPDCSHLISTSEDGSIKVFRQGSWQLEKVWSKAHKGEAVTCLAVHPSGKMALSVGKDHTLRTWNLVKGRRAYTTNLFSRCRQLEHITWSPGGDLVAIPMDSKLEITSTEKAGLVHTLHLETKITACTFLSDEVVCVGEVSGMVTGHSTLSSLPLWMLPGFRRARGLAYLHGYLVVGAISDILVYSAPDVTAQPQLVTSLDTGCRITCLALYDYKSEMEVKKEPTEKEKSKNKEENTSSASDKKLDRVPSSEFKPNETPRKSLKKRKFSNENSFDVVCSPKSQKWIVEDSNR